MPNNTTTSPPWANRIVEPRRGGAGEPAAKPAQLACSTLSIRPTLWKTCSSRSAWCRPSWSTSSTGHLVDGHLRVELALRRGEPTHPGHLRRALRGGGARHPRLPRPHRRHGQLPTARSSPSCSRASRTPSLPSCSTPWRANRIALDLGSAGLTDPDEVPSRPRSRSRSPAISGCWAPTVCSAAMHEPQRMSCA